MFQCLLTGQRLKFGADLDGATYRVGGNVTFLPVPNKDKCMAGAR